MLLPIIIGGLIGLSIAGFPGFLVGAFIAVVLFGYLRSRLKKRLINVQSGFLESLFAVMGALCKADGVVTRNEIQMAETLFQRYRLSGEQREKAKAAFNRGKSANFDLDAELAHFRATTGSHPALLQAFLQAQVSAVAADGVVHPAEHEMLIRVARGLGLPEAQVDQLEAMLRGAQNGAGAATSQQQLDDAYQALGVSPSHSDAEIKKAYRKLMSENHPDKIAGRGLPESMREMAEQRTSEISHAYDLVREARKSNA